MFDVGFTEILLLSLVGLLVLGPERLPRVARTLGGFARKARSSWLDLKRSIEAELRAEELKEPLKNFENEIKSTVDELKSGVDSLKDLNPIKDGKSVLDSMKDLNPMKDEKTVETDEPDERD
jgi:sec-independent protein translocase protein TatB